MSNETVLTEILAAADAAYQEGLARLHEDLPTGERGDTLADFIAIEIRDVCRDAAAEDMVRDALNAMERAENEMTAVRSAIQDLL